MKWAQFIKFILLSLPLASPNLYAESTVHCPTGSSRSLELGAEQLSELGDSITSRLQEQLCLDSANISDRESFEDHIQQLIIAKKSQIGATADRHLIGRQLNQCSPENNSNGLVISFSGTGSYNPISHSLMADLIRCEHLQKVDPETRRRAYSLIYRNLKSSSSPANKWSGIEQGPMGSFLDDPALNAHFQNFHFASFPSEESEFIADPAEISLDKIRQLPHEVAYSRAALPLGIQNAFDCTIRYFSEARRQGITPKLIVQSHSSGGRSVVKFLEHLKSSPLSIEADLVITLDPVKEAHHAIQEVLEQLPENSLRSVINRIPKVSLPVTPVMVWSRSQPQSLYKTSNTRRWINFYQQVDTEGIGMPVKFGIYGSPIHNADGNHPIRTGLSSKAHGEITYHQDVLNTIKSELLDVFE
jgi:hypothetical protein